MVLSDADLAILARAADRYQDYAADVRREYAHVPDPAFRSGRAAILAGFAARTRIIGPAPGTPRGSGRPGPTWPPSSPTCPHRCR